MKTKKVLLVIDGQRRGIIKGILSEEEFFDNIERVVLRKFKLTERDEWKFVYNSALPKFLSSIEETPKDYLALWLVSPLIEDGKGHIVLKDVSKMEWTKFDSDSSQEEGWDIFYCEGSADGLWQIQRIDEPAILDSDERAWELVGSQTTEIQKKALSFVLEKNPKEFKRIQPYLKEKDFISFGDLGINMSFRFVDQISKGDEQVMSKITESQYILIGQNGAYSVSVEERKTLKVYLV